MKRTLFFALVGLGLLAGYASATAATTWNRGDLFLTSGIELTGDLNYNWKAEIVQLRQGTTIKAYSAFQVKAFRYFDTKLNTLRTFASVEYAVRPSLRRLLFMEQLISGPMTVYRRLHHQHEPFLIDKPAAFGSDQELIKDIDGFDYFVSQGDGLINLNDFHRQLWPLMEQEYEHELTQFSSTLLIDKNSTLARLLLINQYNSLKVETAAASAKPRDHVMYGQ